MHYIKAVVFDLDGVLFDAVDLHYHALNKALVDCGYVPISEEEHNTTYNGLPTKTKMRMLGLDEGEVSRVNDRKQIVTREMLAQAVQPDPRLVAVMQHLSSLGYKLACASNSVRASVDIMTRGTGVAPFMEFTLSNEDVGNPKPHPEIYHKAAQKLNLVPCEQLVVEDSPHGQRAAIESGSRLCVVRNPLDVTAEHILDSIHAHEAVGWSYDKVEEYRRLLSAMKKLSESGSGN